MAEPEIAIVTMERHQELQETLDHLEDLGLIERVKVVDGSSGDMTKEVCGDFRADWSRQSSSGMT
ncbi:MAG: hypothetical protein ABEJ83_03475, partial [Candidatus Nanohaloarchaea archaeon]